MNEGTAFTRSNRCSICGGLMAVWSEHRPECPKRYDDLRASSRSVAGALQAPVPAREDPDVAQSAENADMRGGERT